MGPRNRRKLPCTGSNAQLTAKRRVSGELEYAAETPPTPPIHAPWTPLSRMKGGWSKSVPTPTRNCSTRW